MKTVLIIEDNLEIRENTTEILELEGFKVISADSGKEGIKAAVQYQPDIVLCDIMMPQMDGYVVLKDLKDNPLTTRIPFVYVTASTEKREVNQAMEMGANGYVRKPFDIKELLDVIHKCLKV